MKKIVASASVEPVTMDDVKLHLRLNDDTTEDTLIQSLVTRARMYCENHTGRSFATQTISLMLDAFPSGAIVLPAPPIQSVTSVVYVDSAGTETTFTDYLVDLDAGRITPAYGKSWPSFTAYPVNPVRVTYVAGYTELPEPLKQAILLLVGNWYENREDAVLSGKQEAIGFSAKALMAQYKVRWWD